MQETRRGEKGITGGARRGLKNGHPKKKEQKQKENESRRGIRAKKAKR